MLYEMTTSSIIHKRNLNFKKFKFIMQQIYTDSWHCYDAFEHTTSGETAFVFYRSRNTEGLRIREMLRKIGQTA